MIFVCVCRLSHSQTQNYVPGELIIKIVHPTGSRMARAFESRINDRSSQMQIKANWKQIYHVRLTNNQDVHQAILNLKSDPSVQYAEPNYYLTKESVSTGQEQTFSQSQVSAMNGPSSDPLTSAPINGIATWQYVQTLNPTTTPVVAIVDTGLDMTHPVFQQSEAVWINPGETGTDAEGRNKSTNGIDDDNNGYIDDVNGWNFVANSNAIYDDDGHGTHVSGITLAVGQDIYDTPFATAKIHLMPLKFLDSTGVGTTTAAIAAIYYAIGNGASIINNSWGGPAYSFSLNEVIAAAYNQGIVFSAAAGNASSDNDTTPTYPASYDVPNILAIAASDNNDYLASFSNYGFSSVGVAAPGLYILSTLPGGYYGTMSGTSMATPYASGTAALMKLVAPTMLAYQIKNILYGQADVKTQLASLVSTSARTDSLSAMQAAQSAVVQTSQPAYTYSQRDLAMAGSSGSSSSGGCGLVARMAKDFSKPNDKNSSPETPPSWTGVIVLLLIVAPVVLATYLRKLRQRRGVDKRRYERFEMQSEIRIHTGENELIGAVSSISLGGVGIHLKHLLEQGRTVQMSIASPDGQNYLDMTGQIVWSRDSQSYGVAFSNATRTTLDQIESWTKGLKKTD